MIISNHFSTTADQPIAVGILSVVSNAPELPLMYCTGQQGCDAVIDMASLSTCFEVGIYVIRPPLINGITFLIYNLLNY